MRRATGTVTATKPKFKISINALREESDVAKCVDGREMLISINALREESDTIAIRPFG